MVLSMDIMIHQKATHDLYSTPLLQQIAFWSDVKNELGFKPLAFDLTVREKDIRDNSLSSAHLIDDILILTKSISPDECIAYAPYEPLLTPCEERQGEFIESLSEALRCHLPNDCILIRYDLPWLKSEDGLSKEHEELRLNWSTANHNIRASFTNMLPSHTAFVELDEDEESLLDKMKSKTRYNIRLAERKCVSVRQGSRNDLPIFLSLYRETAERNEIRNHSEESFEALFESKEDDAIIQLLIAEKEGEALSAMFLSVTDDMASYLYGASSSYGRENMSTYMLQKEAMLRARSLGANTYDMFGIAPSGELNHPLSGLSRFKLGFGGYRVSRMGCWDYPLSEKAERFYSEERSWQSYHTR